MLAACGLQSLDQLYSHLPKEALLQRRLALKPGISEYEIVDYFTRRGEECGAD